ncbi:MAG: hypothetical protein RMM17_10150 [Acidobacteriota bacterium]|nr:hypothetical protein [Blastocatellia bacterium]MDW8413031.1 hypothetical protein [Acidobacteriota bacterium]
MKPEVLQEDLQICPNPTCNRETGSELFCNACGEGFCRCSQCGAAVRLLAAYCRCCGYRLDLPRVCTEGSSLQAYRLAVPQQLRPLWSDTVSSEIHVAPLALSGLLVLVDTQGKIYLKRIADGKTLRTYDLQGSVAACPAIDGNLRLFVAADTMLYCIDLYGLLYGSVNEIIWKKQVLLPFKPILILLDKILSIEATADRAALLRIYRMGDAEQIAQLQVSTDGRVSKPVMLGAENSLIVMITADGRILLLDLQHGQLLDAEHLRKPLDISTLTAASSCFYFSSQDGQVWKGDLRESKLELQLFAESGGVVSSLGSSDNYVAIGLGSGLVLLDRYARTCWQTPLDGYPISSVFCAETFLMAVDNRGTLFVFDYGESVPRSRARVGNLVLTPAFSDFVLVYVETSGTVRALACC